VSEVQKEVIQKEYDQKTGGKDENNRVLKLIVGEDEKGFNADVFSPTCSKL